MINKTITALLLLISAYSSAQLKDTLFVTSGDSTYAYAIKYVEVEESDQHTKVAKYVFDMGRTAVEIDHKRGKPSGIYRSYYPDGQLMEFGVYGWGTLNGDWKEYDEFGTLIVKGLYKNGKKDGIWAFIEEGIVGRYKNDLKSGRWKYYEGNRVIRSERYKKGVLIK